MRTRHNDRQRERPLRYSREQQPIQPRVTDQEIQKWISRQHGFVPESAWILHRKEQFGLVAPGTAQAVRQDALDGRGGDTILPICENVAATIACRRSTYINQEHC